MNVMPTEAQGKMGMGIRLSFFAACLLASACSNPTSDTGKVTVQKAAPESTTPSKKSFPLDRSTWIAVDRKPAKSKSSKELALVKQDAGNGDSGAQIELGWHYLVGDGITKDPVKSFDLFQKAAASGNADGYYYLGLAYLFGDGVAVDVEKAWDNIEKAANLGQHDAQQLLGQLEFQGGEVQKAVGWWSKAADKGSSLAKLQLGLAYCEGKGVEKNQEKGSRFVAQAALVDENLHAEAILAQLYANGQCGLQKDLGKAISLWTHSAEHGEPLAQLDLGEAYKNGKGVVRNFAQSTEFFRTAALGGNVDAQYRVGVAYLTGEGIPRDTSEGLSWIKQSAEKEFPPAQLYLGLLYRDGRDVEKNDSKYFELTQKAADRGYSLAEFELGVAFSRGLGVEKSAVNSVDWWRKASDQGLAIAQNSLGNCYADGVGVPKDASKAVELYRLGAQQGDRNAQANLARSYGLGLGVKKDIVLAYAWLNLGATDGDDEMLKMRSTLEQEMSPLQLSEAQKLSSLWTKGQPISRSGQ